MTDNGSLSNTKQTISILIVDDDQDLLTLGKFFLERTGDFRVDIMTSAQKALNSSPILSYDAIVSDYKIHEMDGIEFLKAVREQFGDIPFILFTGRGREEVAIEAINNGADFYLQKGICTDIIFVELAHKIRQAVRRNRAEKALRESESQFRSFFETTYGSFSLFDEEGKVIEWNVCSEQITGILKEDAIGKYIWDLTLQIAPHNHLTVKYREIIMQAIQASLSTGAPVFNESHIVESMSRDGTVIFIRQVIFPIKTNTGFCFGSMLQDITKEKLTEKALQESEERYRGMTERSSDLILILDSDLGVTYASPSAQSIIGYDSEELMGKTNEFVVATLFSQNCPDFINNVRTVMMGDIVNNIEIQITKKDGTTAFVNMYAVPTILNGIITGAQISMRDITEKRKAQEALRESEEKFLRFATKAQDMFFRISLPDRRFKYVSPASVALTGYSPQEFYADQNLLNTLIHPAWQENLHKILDAIFAKNVPSISEYQIIDRSGRVRWFNQRNVLVTNEKGNPVTLEGIITDVSVRKDAEQKLRRSEQRFFAATLNTGAWIWEVDQRGIITYSSPAVEDIIGYQPDELIGKVHFFDLFDPSVRDEQKASAMEIFGPYKSFNNFISLCGHKNGSPVILKTSGTPLFDEDGTFIGYCGVVMDVTKEKEAVDKLVESEARYRLLADNVHDVIWTTDEKMRLTYISPSVMALQGLTPKDVMNKPLYDLFTPESTQFFFDNYNMWLDTLQISGKIPAKIALELKIRCKDGSHVWVEMMITPIYDIHKKCTGFVGVTRDINLKRKAEKTLRRTNRQLNLLTSITRHDILNKITVIYGNLEVAEMEESNPVLSDSLERMKKATQEIQSQIEFTRVYEDLGVHEPQWIQLGTVIPRLHLPDSVTLTADIQDISIFADPMLEKVFFNLLDNSVRHGERVSGIRVSARESDLGLIVVWEDNGVGIADNEKEQIFERGFGKNTGLGMFLVREILSLTGISIIENGKRGEGARFEIRVPKEGWRLNEGKSGMMFV